MQPASEESQLIERELKNLLSHWDKEDSKQFGQQFVGRFGLDLGGRWTFQIRERIGRNLTEEEVTLLDYYYLLLKLRAESNQMSITVREQLLRDLRYAEEQTHQLHMQLKSLEKRIEELQIRLQDLDQGKPIEQLGIKLPELYESIEQLRVKLDRLTNRSDNQER